MKKTRFAALLLAAVTLLAAFTACSVSVQDADNKKDERPYVICTIFPQYDFLKNIVGDTMRLELLVTPGGETHSFAIKDISASHLNEMLDADLIVSVGGESDEKLMEELEKFMSNNKAAPTYLKIVDLVKDKLEEDGTVGVTIETDEPEEHEHEGEEEFDEHVWTSPKRAIEIVQGLTNAVCALDDEKADTYRANSAAYIKKLEELDGKLTDLTSKKTYDTLVFADRFPFRYLCYDYGINAHAAFKGCSTSIEPEAAVYAKLLDTASELALPVILYVDGSKPIHANNIAAKTGAQAMMLHACHNISQSDYENESYLSLMEKNIEVLKKALGVRA